MQSVELKQYVDELHKRVTERLSDRMYPGFSVEAFTDVVIEDLSEDGICGGLMSEASSICYAEIKSAGSKPGGRICAWSLSSDGTTLDLYTSRYYGRSGVEGGPSMSLSEIQKELDAALGFFKRSDEALLLKLEESSNEFRAVRAISQAKSSVVALNLYFLTDAKADARNLTERSAVGPVDVRRHVWDIEKLWQTFGSGPEMLQIDFANDYIKHGGAVPCLAFHDTLGEFDTYLAFFPATLLVAIYDRYKQRLLERNVRAFLQAKGKVNKGLQQTLREEPNWFLAYNNGLCCTASRVGLREGEGGHAHLEWAEDFQIVNGGQTTASLYYAYKDPKSNLDLSQVAVQVKLTVLGEPSRAAEIVPLISKYANSQNKVSNADLFANGKYHVDLERFSRSIWAPTSSGLGRLTRWFYERARGSYLVEKASQKGVAAQKAWTDQNPPNQKFTKTDLAKFIHAWEGLPHLTCRGAEKNFNEFAQRLEDLDLPIVDDTYFRRVAARAILWRSTEAAFDDLGLKSFRAIAVAYSIAWLVAKSGRRIDLDKIWESQALPRSIVDALRRVLPVARAFVDEVADRTRENPEGPPKTEKFWKEFREREIDLPPNWMRDLAPSPIEDPVAKDDATDQRWKIFCRRFGNDTHRLSELYISVGKRAPKGISQRTLSVLSSYPSWRQLRAQPFGLTKADFVKLVEVIAAAVSRNELIESEIESEIESVNA